MDKYLVANYHTHTTRCKHATGTEKEYIEAAIKAGIQILGFSDHAPCPFENGYVSRIRMDMSAAEEYVRTIRALQKEYEKHIKIYVGFETEYLPQYFNKQAELFDSLEIFWIRNIRALILVHRPMMRAF